MNKSKIIFIIIILILSNITAGFVSAKKIEAEKTILLKDEKIQESKDYNLDKPDYKKGELIVKFKNEIQPQTKNNQIKTNSNTLDKLNAKYEAKDIIAISSKENTPLSNIYKIEINGETDIKKAVEEYKTNSNVLYAEPNYYYYSCNTPNDPLLDRQWGLNQSFDYDIDGPEAWDIETGDSNIIIAIIDTGVDYNHPDIKDNIWRNTDETTNGEDTDLNGYDDDVVGWDFFNNDNDPIDDNGHGTHCAGIAAANSNNDLGVAGVSWNCQIMPIKILGKEGTGQMSNAASAIFYAYENGARVVSLSLGNTFSSKLMNEVITYVTERGVVVIAATGNDDRDKKFYPASYENCIGVSATDDRDLKASFSNYGDWVDIAAPGEYILSLRANGTSLYGENSSYIVEENYTYASGTSMACPFVAGVAGLVLSKNSALTSKQVREKLYFSADRLPDKLNIGRGRLNAYRALTRGPGPATAIISSPKHYSDVKGVIDINGSVSGEGFKYYTLDYRKGLISDQENWIELVNSSEPVDDDLLYSLDTEPIDEGLYVIRLKLFCDNGVYRDLISVFVNNYENTFFVDDDGEEADFSRITDGILFSGKGDTVFVFNGTYNESLYIDKKINLYGESYKSVKIFGNGTKNGIHVLADGVKIAGFTVENYSSINNDLSFDSGILLDDADDCVICCNNLTDNGCGIKLISSCRNKIYLNNFNFPNAIGVRVIKNSNFNKINENNFISYFAPRISYEFASYKYSYFNNWNRNYWEERLGNDILIFRFLPRRIPYRFWDLSGILLRIPRIRSNFDFLPAKEPYDIPDNYDFYYDGEVI